MCSGIEHLFEVGARSLILSPLKLVSVALQCFHSRSTSVYENGDMSYVLMGLLRQRPNIVREDSAYQAFARLSLANDSNMLLERLICLLPRDLDGNWWALDDAWNAMLWDIYPKVQVCGLGQDDTVILDGAHGAAIRWDRFIPVITLGQETRRHLAVRYIARSMPLLFLLGLMYTIIGAPLTANAVAVVTPRAILLALGGVIVLLLPYLLRLIYSTKVHDSQPLFFGFEGYLDIYQVELLIFGSYEGRLQWSTASSPLSRHCLDREGMKADFLQDKALGEDELKKIMQKENMYTGQDPVKTDESVKTLVAQASHGSDLDKKVFTLGDTYTMSVTLFEAVRPPVAVVLCGSEGGMQRALLCSEDWTTGTLYRETVTRMETRVWDKMDTLARIRLGLKRDEHRAPLRSSGRGRK